MSGPESEVQFHPVSDLTTQPIHWLWPGRLALGKLSLLEGDPGLGKSLLTLDLAARLSRGLPFPDGAPGPGPGSSLILNAEDGEADTVRSRLLTLDADLTRIFIQLGEPASDHALRLPSNVRLLDDAL